MDFQTIIAERRDGRKHTFDELVMLANGAADGSIPDYQLAAWLMAAYERPLDREETAWLTTAMADSGARMDLTGLPKPWVDKHSTGGVGDKTSIVLLPLLASCGLTIVKMSGRGLGITGGTVDKLSSIPGFHTDLAPQEMKEQAARIGLAVTGQTPDLAPADKVLYALRDTTATVESVPLIVSSILSKKLAGGADTVVLDVKCGQGAFMHSIEEGRNLADWLADVAVRCGLNVRVAISDMEQPLGSAVGNALEVKEAVRVLNGEQSRFSEFCLELAGITLAASGLQPSREAGRSAAAAALSGGQAAAKAREWFAAQGATVDVVSDASLLPSAPVRQMVKHQGDPGWIEAVNAEAVGHAVVEMGGGRQRKEDSIDVTVGIELQVEVGSRVEPGQMLFTVHAASDGAAAVAQAEVFGAIRMSSEVVLQRPALVDAG